MADRKMTPATTHAAAAAPRKRARSRTPPPPAKRVRVLGPTRAGHARQEAAAAAAAAERAQRDHERRVAAAVAALARSPPGSGASSETDASLGAGAEVAAAEGVRAAAAAGAAATAAAAVAEEELRRPVHDLEKVPDAVVTAGLTSLLTQLSATNVATGLARSCDHAEERLRMFFSRTLQPFALEAYVERIVNNVRSRPILVTALAFVDRLFDAHADMALSPSNMHRVLVVSVLLAYKTLEDEPCSQDFFRAIGGIPCVEELNDLEAEFLHQINWRCFVTADLYHSYYATLVDRCNVLYPRGVVPDLSADEPHDAADADDPQARAAADAPDLSPVTSEESAVVAYSVELRDEIGQPLDLDDNFADDDNDDEDDDDYLGDADHPSDADE